MQAPAPPKNKLLGVPSAPVELTPLTRLARFKEIRDRNLSRANLTKSKRGSLFVQQGSSNMLNGNSGTNTNGVAHTTNGNPEHHEVPSGPKMAKSPFKNGSESLEPSPKRTDPSPKKVDPSPQKPSPSARNGVEAAPGSSPQNGVEPPVQEQPQEEENDLVVVVLDEDENEAGSGSDGDLEVEIGLESEGSSLDVVIDESSSGEWLDMNVTAIEFQSPLHDEDLPMSAPGPSAIQEPASDVDEPYVPDVIKRLKSGGHISSRPTLRGKRRQEDDANSASGRKRHCDESSSVAASLSTSWQFFSPSAALKRVWNRQEEPPAEAKPEDDSMAVNVSSSNPPKAQKWCRIM